MPGKPVIANLSGVSKLEHNLGGTAERCAELVDAFLRP